MKKMMILDMKSYANLVHDRLENSRNKRKIAIVTTDFAGPEKNGGIGTAYATLAKALAREGHSVTVVFANPGSKRAEAEFDFWAQHYNEENIRLERLAALSIPLEWDTGDYYGFGAPLSYQVYEYLKSQTFDIVHFPESGGIGYYTLLAKKTGIAFQKTLFCVIVHGPTIWQMEYNLMLPEGVEELQLAYLERKSVELADVVVGPSQYALEWVKSRGWKLPKRSFVEQYLYPREDKPQSRGSIQSFDEIVFFGRIEPRKGTDIFCEAVNKLPQSLLKEKKVTFLGSFSLSVSPWSQTKFIRTLEKTPIKWQVIRNYDRDQAIKYLKTRNVLVVIPSLAETLGYTVMECIHHSIPFIASDIPPFRELIDVSHQKEVLFKNEPEALCEKIQKVAEKGLNTDLRFAVEPQKTQKRWMQWHSQVKLSQSRKLKSKMPLITVCLLHRDRPQYLEQSLKSLKAQTYKRFDVIVVDNASQTLQSRSYLNELEKKLEIRNWHILRLSKHLSPSEARNKVAKLAKGKFILFMDDDNVARPNELETFAKVAAHTDADIFTCFSDRFFGNAYPKRAISRWLASGDDIATGVYYNVYGDMNALIRKKTFLALKGLKKQFQAGHEDWEFFARAVLGGAKLFVIPEALYWYRKHETNFSRDISPSQSTRLHLSPLAQKSVCPEFDLLFASALAIERHMRGKKIRIREGGFDYSQVFFDPKHRFLHPIYRAENQQDLSKIRVSRAHRSSGLKLRTGADSWLELPKMAIPQRDILLEIKLTSSHFGAMRISFDVIEKGQTLSRQVVRSVREGQNHIYALLDGRELFGPLRISPLDRKATCHISQIGVYESD